MYYKMSKKNIRLSEKIIENRYKISFIAIIISTIMGFFLNNISFVEWICTTDKMLSLWWTTKFFALLLGSYELFNIITNNKEVSVAGTVVLAFSGCVVWNFTKIDAIILGEIITVLIYKMIKEKDLKKNILKAIAIIGCVVGYMYTFRPFAISFGYLFFALILWILVTNKKELKETKNTKIILITTILIAIISACVVEIVFPNTYLENPDGLGSGIDGLFSYLYNPFLLYNNLDGKEYFGSIITMFPLPLILSLFYMYKKEKHLEFLLPVTVITVLETVYCISGFPNIIDKFTMLSNVGGMRVVPAVQFANLLIMFYLMENVVDFKIELKHAVRTTLVLVCVLAFIKYPIVFASRKFLYLFVCELSVLSFLFLNYSNKKYRKVFLVMLVLFTLMGGLPVNFLNNL